MPVGDQCVGELGPLLVGAGAPVDAVRLGHRRDLGDEVEDALVSGRAARLLGGGSACVSAVMPAVSFSRIAVAALSPPVRRLRRRATRSVLDGVSVESLLRSAGVVAARRWCRGRIPVSGVLTYWIDQGPVAAVTPLDVPALGVLMHPLDGGMCGPRRRRRDAPSRAHEPISEAPGGSAILVRSSSRLPRGLDSLRP